MADRGCAHGRFLTAILQEYPTRGHFRGSRAGGRWRRRTLRCRREGTTHCAPIRSRDERTARKLNGRPRRPVALSLEDLAREAEIDAPQISVEGLSHDDSGDLCDLAEQYGRPQLRLKVDHPAGVTDPIGQCL